MGKRVMTADSALDRLRDNRIQVKEGKRIPKGDYSLKVWAAIDCLCNYHGYTLAG